MKQDQLHSRGKRKTQAPCSGCFLHQSLCLCDSIQAFQTQTKLTLVIHHRELRRTTNTGTLALKALPNSEQFVRGLKDSPLDVNKLILENHTNLLFFPSEDAVELNADFVKTKKTPFNLIVPDGNWRQASKIHYRYPELAEIPRVMIKAPNLEKYFLRKETTAEGMATLQAIAYAFGVLENKASEENLLALYRLKLERTMKARGGKSHL